MVYKRYVKKGGKVFGPYYYESYRDKEGKTRTRFIGGPEYQNALDRLDWVDSCDLETFSRQNKDGPALD